MNNQSFSKIWIIVVVMVIIGGGILAWQYFGVPKEEVRAPEEVPEKEEVIEDETADWKTYRNEEYGFEIKYPKDCHIEIYKNFLAAELNVAISNTKGSLYSSPEAFVFIIEVFDNPNHLSAKDIAEQHLLISGQETILKELNINGIPAVQTDPYYKVADIYYFADTFIVNYTKTKAFEMGGKSTSKGNFNIVDQILSTFRLLE